MVIARFRFDRFVDMEAVFLAVVQEPGEEVDTITPVRAMERDSGFDRLTLLEVAPEDEGDYCWKIVGDIERDEDNKWRRREHSESGK